MKITLADYLVKKLVKLGVHDFFGLPGDFNFNILDSIEDSMDARWINCTNELNAGYCADGYARVKGFGAVVTTFGVGELSAINAIAGSYSEGVPVIKIVGAPSSTMIKNNALLHHNFQKPDYYAFERAFSNVVETTAFLDEYNAKTEIDRIIEIMVKTRKPVYVAIPSDICFLEIDDETVDIELVSDVNNLENTINHISRLVNSSEKPVIIADFLVKRFGLEKELENLINITKFPTTSLLMGKGSIDETSESFMGTYMGNLSSGNAHEVVESSDCVISIGTLLSDLNTGGFAINETDAFKVNIQADYVVVEDIKYENVWMKDVFEKLLYTLKENAHSSIKDFAYEKAAIENVEPLKLEYVFPRIQEFLREDDLVFIETGIISFASALMKLPKNCFYNNQMLWGSIGWATPAMFGGAIADSSRRPILFTGEGAHQLTVQEVANMLHHNVKPIIIVLNNSGYTIERVLSRDPMDKYNEITKWNYSKLPELFDGEFCSIQARTNKEFDEALITAAEEQKNKLCYIEIFADKMDVPSVSTRLIENFKKNSKKFICL